MSFAVAGGPHPPRGCTSLAALRKKLETLYRLRTSVDYVAVSASAVEAEFGLAAANEVLQIIAQRTGWAL